jgi:hypothetical protein
MANSDFAPEYFSVGEQKKFSALLLRLRAFEETIVHSYRQLDAKIDALDQASKENKNDITATKCSITKLRSSLNNMGDWVKTSFENINHAVEDFEEDEAYLDKNIEMTVTADGKDKNEPEENETIVCVFDPFLENGAFVDHFDGNPTVSFLTWYERFSDLLSLATDLTEPQKLARLRFCLSGQARTAFDSIVPAPTSLQTAFDKLKVRFNNGQTKILARQALSICRQAPNESVFTFSNRLTETVKSALTGESDAAVKRRLFDEFLERLQPNLQYEVKSQRPTDFDGAYELALHFELLMKTKMGSTENLVNKLAEKVEALTVQRPIICYACRGEGHIARDCSENRNGSHHRNYYVQSSPNHNRYNHRRRVSGGRDYRSPEGRYNRERNYRRYSPDYRDSRQRNYYPGSPGRYSPDYRDHRHRSDYSGSTRRKNGANDRYGNGCSSSFDRSGSPGVRVASPDMEMRSSSSEFSRRRSSPRRMGSPLFLM